MTRRTENIIWLLFILAASCTNHSRKLKTIKVEPDSISKQSIQPCDTNKNSAVIFEEQRKKYLEEYRIYLKVNDVWNFRDTNEVKNLGMYEMMTKLLPKVIQYAKSDSLEPFYNNLMQKRYPEFYINYRNSWGDKNQRRILETHLGYDKPEILLIGKFIDKKNCLAIAYDMEHNYVEFYRLEKNYWKRIGFHQGSEDESYDRIYFEELNGKSGLEIVMATDPNMNGNSWMLVFAHNEQKDSILFAGNFSTYYSIQLEDGSITETYEGSWYMDLHKTIYTWENDFLTPQKMAILIVPKSMDDSTLQYQLEYYQNIPDSNGKKGLRMIFSEQYNEKLKKHQKYWDDFFESGGE
ncbi:MAG: hypothetical protein H6607_10575 [Flavobacteriales bacterium]|nr:hypothetical protein [Flavobacteriales bacterium]